MQADLKISGSTKYVADEPAAASNLSVQPNLDAAAAGQDGLLYRTAELGALEAGRQLPVEIRYTKTDSRTSSEILKLAAPESTSRATTDSVQGVPGWLLVLAVAAVRVRSCSGLAVVALAQENVRGPTGWRRLLPSAQQPARFRRSLPFDVRRDRQ